MNNTFDGFTHNLSSGLPTILGALIILLIGWLIAKGVKALVVKLMERTSWDKKLFRETGTTGSGTNSFIGNLFYYLIMVIVFLIVLEKLGVSSVLSPLENMVSKFLVFIPHLIAAGIIATIGYMLAKFVSGLISFGGNFLERIVIRTGFKDTDKIIRVIRGIVFLVIFIPLLIQAINALQLESISNPLNAILSGFIGILGDVIVAAVVLIIFLWGGKYLTRFLGDLFRNLGFDQIAIRLQLQNMIGPNQSFSRIIAGVLYFFIAFFGVITAVDILQLYELTYILNEILAVTGSIAFGVVILIIGNFISTLIYSAMMRSDNNRFIASVVRYASLGLFLGISLRAMGIANGIVELAFGLTLGSVAVVIALSYGLGGREAAGEHFKEIIQKFKKGKNEDQNPPHEPPYQGM